MRILEHLALSLNQHSKLTAISVGFINMEKRKSMHAHTHGHVQTHTYWKLSELPGICKQRFECHARCSQDSQAVGCVCACVFFGQELAVV